MLTSEMVRAARALLRWEQKQLASASGVSLPTVKRLETAPGLLSAHAPTIAALQRALEEAGVQFIPENGGGAGVRLRNREPSAAIDHGKVATDGSEARADAAGTADTEMSGMDASKEEKGRRRRALTDESADVIQARSRTKARQKP